MRVFVLMALAASLLIAACKPQTYDEKTSSFNKNAGNQAELTATHLIVRWPAVTAGVGTEAVTLKIPRAYFHESPGRKDEQGGLEELTLMVGVMPGPRPIKYMDIPMRGAPADQITAFDAYRKQLVRVYFKRSGMGGPRSRESIENRIGSSKIKDGTAYGLERHSSYMCLQEYYPPDRPENPIFVKWISERTSDDPSPKNCRINRDSADYYSPPETVPYEQRVTIWCAPTGCTVFLNAAGRSANFYLDPKNLEKWKDYADPVRNLLKSFVTVEAAPTTPVPNTTTQWRLIYPIWATSAGR